MAGSMFGPYRLDGLIGRGGMGEVHRAYDTSQKRAVALKLLPVHLSADEEYRARFQREAEVAATLREPHVIPIHRYGEIAGRLFLDMRLVDGEDLAAVIERDNPLDCARAVAIIEQVAAALDAAHADGLIHRDVKPSNILVSTTRPGGPDFVYLVDFGIARPLAGTSLTSTGNIIGTLPYMAPERFLDGRVDHRVDVYSLACLLFELLSGRCPFPGSDFALISAHLYEPPPALSGVRGGLPPALDGVIGRGLAKSPESRQRSAGEFAAEAAQAVAAHARVPAAEAPLGKSRRTERASVSGPEGKVRRRVATATRVPRFPEQGLVGHDGKVFAVATATVADRAVVVSAGEDASVRVWDLVTGRPVGGPLVGHTDSVLSLATRRVGGRAVAVSAGCDATVRVWDLSTLAPAAPPLRAHPGDVCAVAVRGSRMVSGGVDRALLVWDLSDLEAPPTPLRSWTNRPAREIEALAIGRTDDGPVAVSAGADGRHHVWNLGTRRLAGGPYRFHDGPVFGLSIADVGGKALGVSTGVDDDLHVWDVATGRRFGRRLVGDTGLVTAVTTTELRGSPVVVSGDVDGAVRVWDLMSTSAVGRRFDGHRGEIRSLAVAQLDGSPVAVSGSADGTVRLWDLTAMVG